MTIDLLGSLHANPFLTSELNDIFFKARFTGSGLFFVQLKNTEEKYETIFYSMVDMIQGKEVHFSGIGEMIKDKLLCDDKLRSPIGDVRFSVPLESVGSGVQVFQFEISVLTHSGSPDITGPEIAERVILNDCRINIIPRIEERMPEQFIYAYLKNVGLPRLFARIIEGRSQSSSGGQAAMNRIKEIYYGSYPGSNNGDGAVISVIDRTDDEIFAQMEFFYSDWSEGASFLFSNSFGLKEYVFFPGELSEAPKNNFTEVIIGGSSKIADSSIEYNYSIKVVKAPYWLVQNAKALLSSDKVYWIRNNEFSTDDKSIFLEHSNVIINDISGDLSARPDELSDFTISFKLADL